MPQILIGYLTNYGYNNTSPILLPGDYITSPSDFYYGLLTTDGQFVICRGANPSLNPPGTGNDIFTTTAPTTQNVSATYFMSEQEDANLVIYGGVNKEPPNPVIWAAGGGDHVHNPPGYAQLSDNGRFSTYEGTVGAPVKTYFDTNFEDPVENATYTDFVYESDKATFTNVRPGRTIQNTATNDTSVTQSQSVTVTSAETQGFAWSLTEGISNTTAVKTTFEVGIPRIAKAGIEVSDSLTLSFSAGQTWTSSTTLSGTETLPISVPPDTKVTALSNFQTADVSVPFTYSGTIQYRSGAILNVTGAGVLTAQSEYLTNTTFKQQPSGSSGA
jgi:hypothetical protein